MRRITPGAATLVLALFAAPAAAAAAPAQSLGAGFTDSTGVVHYAYDASKYPGAEVISQVGTADVDGCTFTMAGSGAAAAGAKVTVVDELSYNPSTCTRTLATATYATALAPPAVKQQLAPTDTDVTGADASATGTPAASASRVKARAAVTVYIGALRLNVENVVQKDVSTTVAETQWSGTSTCVNSATFKAHWGWWSGGFWARDSYSWGHGINCTRAYTNVLGTFHNTPYCWPSTTRTNHKKTWFEGRPRGGWAWSYSISKSGTCAGLFHFEHILTTP